MCSSSSDLTAQLGLGGRCAIALALVLIPVFAWIVKRGTIRQGHWLCHRLWHWRGSGPAIVAILVRPAITAHPIIVNTWGALVSFFSGASLDESTRQSTRNEQADQLIGAWSESPIWGQIWGPLSLATLEAKVSLGRLSCSNMCSSCRPVG